MAPGIVRSPDDLREIIKLARRKPTRHSVRRHDYETPYQSYESAAVAARFGWPEGYRQGASGLRQLLCSRRSRSSSFRQAESCSCSCCT